MTRSGTLCVILSADCRRDSSVSQRLTLRSEEVPPHHTSRRKTRQPGLHGHHQGDCTGWRYAQAKPPPMWLLGKQTQAEPETQTMNLAGKVEELRTQFGMEGNLPMNAVVTAATAELGLEEKVKGLNLMQKIDACLAALGTRAVVPMAEVAPRGMPGAQTVIPMGVAVDESILAVEARIREAEMRAQRAEAALRLQEAEMKAAAAEQALAQQTQQVQQAREAEERATAPQPQSMGHGIPQHGGLDGVWLYETSSGDWTGTTHWGTAITIRGMQAYMQGSCLVNQSTVVYHFASVDPRHITGTEHHVNLACGCCPVGVYGPVPIVGSIGPDGRLTLTIDGSTGTYRRA